MANKSDLAPDPNRGAVYQIRFRGHLDHEWLDWFEGLTITLEEDGNTLLTSKAMDQPALHGLFKKMRDLGIALLSVNCLEPGQVKGKCSTMETKVDASKPPIGMNIRVKL